MIQEWIKKYRSGVFVLIALSLFLTFLIIITGLNENAIRLSTKILVLNVATLFLSRNIALILVKNNQ